MRTHEILCQHTGEYSHTTKDPVDVWRGQVDLKESHHCILNSDDWRHVTVCRWEVRKVELPDWLDPQDWIRNQITWKYTWGMGVSQDWPETWQRGLTLLTPAERLACVKLLKTKTFRSELRRSFREQLEKWLGTPFEDRPYTSPFSPRQWDILIDKHLAREAKRISSALYRNR